MEKKDEKKDAKIDVKDVHLKLLDDLVNVNSLMTLAVFVGLTMATPNIRSLESRNECHAGPKEAKMLILYEVIAFSSFFLSSMVAKVLKLHLYLDGADDKYTFTSPNIDLKELMIALAACGSVAGIISVSLSIVKIVEVRIGLLSCGCRESTAAVWCLGTLVGFAVLIYVVSIAIAIYASFKSDHAKDERNENQKGEDENHQGLKV
ncbi:Maternal effect embryoarrest [Heracleum sosnowskyi]|uniref:Maternal effect embryoarrest n=1 Tax=Heracleum sosnowskyi TaxID=360622 RepID=A0AAD8M0D2_9APIA|nr:Maternal effect embryoarrest [Heracleum sosnowskyi]